MPHPRTTNMDSQRYDISNRRQSSCLPVSSTAVVEGIFPSPQRPRGPWADNYKGNTTTPSGRTSNSENISGVRNASRESLAESCTATLSGDMGCSSPKKFSETPSARHPSLRKSKSSVGRILGGLDCTRSSCATDYILRDVYDDLSSAKGEKDDTQTIRGIPAQHVHDVKRDNKRFPLPSPSHPHPPLFRPKHEVCFTDTYVHEDGHATTRTIIRPRSRSRSRMSRQHGTSTGNVTVRGGLARMRSLDCLRGSNNFEDELDFILLNQTSQNGAGQHAHQHPSSEKHEQTIMRLRVYEERTIVAEEKWRSAIQGMLYQNARPAQWVESCVEVD